MTAFLAATDYSQPALWAVIIGWVMSVTLHEFAHGIVGYWGGDYTVRERGGLTLNPLQYVDPVMSLILPTIFLLMGSVPLPGGVTYIRRDLLRSRAWDSAVSAAGPAMNLILYGLLAIPLMPSFGWIPVMPGVEWTTAQKFVGAMCYLQLMTVFLNLIPVPPLDGFGIIAPHLDPDLRTKLSTPPVSTVLFFGYFMLLWNAPGFIRVIQGWANAVMGDELFRVAAHGFNETFFPGR
jgi:Zn-dependent protease